MPKWQFILLKGSSLIHYVILQVHPEFLFHLSGQQHQLGPATENVIIREVSRKMVT